MGKLIAINISEKRGTEKKEIQEAQLVTDFGIVGDAHAGKWHRQVSLLSFEKIEDFKARGARIENGAFGENLIVSGFDFKTLPLGTRFQIGDALLEMTQIGKQCHSHCAIYQRMGECIMPKEGVFAVVLKGGTIKKGDEVTMIPANFYATVRDRNKAADTLTATVITGKNRGEKLCMMDGKIRAVRSSGAGMYHGLHKHDMNEAAKESISGSDFFNEKHAEEIWKAHLADKHRITIEEQEIYLHSIGNRARLVICGGGHMCYYLTTQLLQAGRQVKIIEKKPERCEELCELLPKATVICGDATDQELLIEEGLDECNAFVALTGMDEENIILGLFAQSRGVPKIVAKVNEDSRAQMVENMGIDSIISAKSATADEIMSYVIARNNSYASANVETMYQLLGGRVKALEFIIKKECEITNVPLKDLPTKRNYLIACIGRKRRVIIPNGNDHLEVGDSVVVVTTNQMINKFSDILA